MYNTTLGISFLFPFVVLFGEMTEVAKIPHLRNATFWMVMMCAGFIVFLVHILDYLYAKLISQPPDGTPMVEKITFIIAFILDLGFLAPWGLQQTIGIIVTIVGVVL